MNSVLLEDFRRIAQERLPWQELRGSTVLVTGATGLIGSLLVRSLLYLSDVHDLQLRVLALVRNPAKAQTIYGAQANDAALRFVIGDVAEDFDVSDDVDWLFHCASVTASKTMVTQPVETIMTAVIGTKNILDLAKEKQVRGMVYLSSMEMYGSFSEPQSAVTEETLGYVNPVLVRSNYPESKRLCENMCVAYQSEYGVPVRIARLAQTFGAGVLPWENRVFMQFARSAMNGEDIVLHTRGLSEGNYSYSADTLRALYTLLLRGEDAQAYNVANPANHTTIAEMAQMVCDRFSDGRSALRFDIPETNVYGYAADTHMTLNADKLCALGWKPEVGLEEAYRRMIAYLKENAAEA